MIFLKEQVKTKEPPTSTVGVRRFCYDSIVSETLYRRDLIL